MKKKKKEELLKILFKKSARRKLLKIFFVAAVALNLVAYQIALPLSFSALKVHAQEEAVSEDDRSDVEEDSEEEEDDADGEQEEDMKEEEEEITNDEEQSDDPEAAEEEAENPEESDSEEIDLGADGQENQDQKENEENDADVVVENENDTQAENEVTSTSETGNNEIVEDEENIASEENNGPDAGETSQDEVAQDAQQEEQGQEPEENNTEENSNDGEESEETEQESDVEEIQTEDPESLEDENSEQVGIENVEGETDQQESGAEIETGDAISNAEIINEINKNITGINWVDTVINLYGLHEEDVDLNSVFLALLEEMLNGASALSNNGQDLVVSNTNNADVSNVATADSNTGSNTVQYANGDAEIGTGDAQAAANIVNIVNTNIVGNNWVFAVVNVFGYWSGNLIVPGENLASFPYLDEYGEVSVANTNEAAISNIVQANADTGNNIAQSEGGSADMNTGDATSTAVSTTVANTNITQNNWFSLAVNSTGNWIGTALNWEGEAASNIFQYFFTANQTNQNGASLIVANFNNANVSNVATANATTGSNSAFSGSGDAQIATGDASAFSNVFNLINTNIVGNNWFFGIVNVVGAWEGDVEFAYPDLEISIDDGKSEANAGDTLEYVVSYKNNGKTPAEDAVITFGLDGDARYSSSSKTMKVSGSSYSWDVGEIGSGESGSFTVKAKVEDDIPERVSNIVAIAQIETGTTEKEKGNNSDNDSTDAYANPDEDANYGYDYDYDKIDSDLKVTRLKTITGPVAGGEIVYNAIIVKNNGEGAVYDVRVKEQMVDSQREELVKFTWPIGDLSEGDEILIEYQLQVNTNALPGNYQFVAYAKGDDPYDDEVDSGKAILGMNIYQLGGSQYFVQGETVVDDQPPFEFLPTANAAEGTVLGISDAASCFPLPLWIWVSALLAYGLALNWSLFPWREGIGERIGRIRGFVIPFAATMGMVAFWIFYRCDAMLWFMISTFLVLLVHLLVRKRLNGNSLPVSQEDPKIVRL